MSDATPEAPRAPSRPLRMAMPLIIFLSLAGLFLVALYGGDPSKLPSALIGKPVPQFDLPGLEGLVAERKPVPGFTSDELRDGKVSIINFWASWCGPCRNEHPYLMQLAKSSGARVYGVNYKDSTSSARRFLGQLGNPFIAVGVDASGRTSLDWGVYGLPETFVVDGNGVIVHKHVGPIAEAAITEQILPAVARAREARKTPR